MSPLLQVLQNVCDYLDSRFASSTVAPASIAKLLQSNACVARHNALSNRLCQLAYPSPLNYCPGCSSAAATAAHVTMLYSAAATCLAFVNAHVGRCLAVLCSVMALKCACRYSSPSMKVSSSPLNLSRHPLTQAQYFSYWLPSALARVCLAGLHPVSLAILLFHPQLLQVMRCLFLLPVFVEPLMSMGCVRRFAFSLNSLPGPNHRGHGQFGSGLHLLPRGPAVHGDVLRVREQRDREHNWLHRHEPEHG